MNSVSASQRRSKILRILLDKGKVQIGELSQLFGVSGETIRKDIIALEKKGLCKKNHGGAIGIGEKEEVEHSSENKLRMAQKALEFIPQHSSIILDSGIICEILAHSLISRKDITVITNSLTIALLLNKNEIKTYIIGGEVKNNSSMNLWTRMCIEQIMVDVAFIEAQGGKKGPGTESFELAEVKRSMIKSAKEAYLFLDGSISQNDIFATFASWQDFDALITDSNISTQSVSELKGKINVLIVH